MVSDNVINGPSASADFDYTVLPDVASHTYDVGVVQNPIAGIGWGADSDRLNSGVDIKSFVVQSDGKYIEAGLLGDPRPNQNPDYGNKHSFVVRFNANMTPDTSFGEDSTGIVTDVNWITHDFPISEVYGMAINPQNGDIVLTGDAVGRDYDMPQLEVVSLLAADFNPTGSKVYHAGTLDPRFNGGKPFIYSAFVSAFTRDPSTGTLSFNDVTSTGATAIRILEDGSILVGGYIARYSNITQDDTSLWEGTLASDFLLLKLTPTGLLDPSFGNGTGSAAQPNVNQGMTDVGGFVSGDFYELGTINPCAEVTTIVVSADGSILVGGSAITTPYYQATGNKTGNGSEWALVKYDDSGRLMAGQDVGHPAFGTNGVVLTSNDTLDTSPSSVDGHQSCGDDYGPYFTIGISSMKILRDGSILAVGPVIDSQTAPQFFSVAGWCIYDATGNLRSHDLLNAPPLDQIASNGFVQTFVGNDDGLGSADYWNGSTHQPRVPKLGSFAFGPEETNSSTGSTSVSLFMETTLNPPEDEGDGIQTAVQSSLDVLKFAITVPTSDVPVVVPALDFGTVGDGVVSFSVAYNQSVGGIDNNGFGHAAAYDPGMGLVWANGDLLIPTTLINYDSNIISPPGLEDFTDKGEVRDFALIRLHISHPAASGLTAVATPTGGVDLSWVNSGSGQTNFEIFRVPTPAGSGDISADAEVPLTGQPIAIVGPDTLNYTDSTDLVPNTSYSYRVVPIFTSSTGVIEQGDATLVARASVLPADTGYVLQATVGIPVTGAMIDSGLVLQQGVDYLIQVSGDISQTADGGHRGDAEYGYFAAGGTPQWWDVQPGSGGYVGGYDYGVAIENAAASQSVDGVQQKYPCWGPLSTDVNHTYSIIFKGEGKSLQFSYHDSYYPDNSSQNAGDIPLNVSIYRALPSGPGAVSALADRANRTITLNWTDTNTGAIPVTNVVLQRSLDGVNFSDLAVLPGNAVTYTDTTALVNTPYTYRVYAENSFGRSDVSSTAFALIEDAAPIIQPIPIQTVYAGQTLNLQVIATDANDPTGASPLAYALAAGASRGAIDNGGLFTYTPPVAFYGGYTSQVVNVTDAYGVSSVITITFLLGPPADSIPRGSATATYDPPTKSVDLSFQPTAGTNLGIATYHWETMTHPNGGGLPLFTSNDLPSSNSTVAKLFSAGDYSFRVTIDNGQGWPSYAYASVSVTPTATSIRLLPQSPVIAAGSTVAVNATVVDQFSDPVLSQPVFSWTVDGQSVIGVSGAVYSFNAPVGQLTDRAYTISAAAAGLPPAADTISVSTQDVPSIPNPIDFSPLSFTQIQLQNAGDRPRGRRGQHHLSVDSVVQAAGGAGSQFQFERDQFIEKRSRDVLGRVSAELFIPGDSHQLFRSFGHSRRRDHRRPDFHKRRPDNRRNDDRRRQDSHVLCNGRGSVQPARLRRRYQVLLERGQRRTSGPNRPNVPSPGPGRCRNPLDHGDSRQRLYRLFGGDDRSRRRRRPPHLCDSFTRDRRRLPGTNHRFRYLSDDCCRQPGRRGGSLVAPTRRSVGHGRSRRRAVLGRTGPDRCRDGGDDSSVHLGQRTLRLGIVGRKRCHSGHEISVGRHPN